MSDNTNPANSLLARAVQGAFRSWNDHRRHEARRTTASMLHSFDDRALADIDLNRGLIDSAVFAKGGLVIR